MRKKKVLISDVAKKDIAGIIRFIALDKPSAAEKFKLLLLKKGQSLAYFSDRGRKIPELKGTHLENYRELIISSCRLIYKISNAEVRILRVLHSRQEFVI